MDFFMRDEIFFLNDRLGGLILCILRHFIFMICLTLLYCRLSIKHNIFTININAWTTMCKDIFKKSTAFVILH